jgi:hypothetical protein
MDIKKIIKEEIDDFDWIKGGDEENQPTIIPGGILDIEKSNFSKEEILQRLHDLGYTWGGNQPIIKDGKPFLDPHRYLLIGRLINDNGEEVGRELKLLHDEDLDWVDESGFSDRVYTT